MGLRVIAGSAGGLLLQSPKRHPLRPTQYRIRQVVFSSLAGRVPGARALDLFAGTGSYGIEALSRGAASAVFVEQNEEAVECIRANLRHCRLTGEIVREDVAAYLHRPPGPGFDLVFADPPYLKTRGCLADDPLPDTIRPHLAADGLLVWEHFAGNRPEGLTGWEVVRHRTYGETGLTFLRSVGN
jgi:16S rRNA (guanine966-N2)-methyltransferase